MRFDAFGTSKHGEGKSLSKNFSYTLLIYIAKINNNKLHTVNVMSGRTNRQSCFTLKSDGIALLEGELAESLNQYFATVAADIQPLDRSCLLSFLPSAREVPIVHSHVVCKKLLQVKRNKAMGPHSISPWIIKKLPTN